MFKSILLLTLLLIPMFSFAQLSIGVRGGFTSSSYSYQPSAGIRSRSVDGIGAPTFAFVAEYFNAKKLAKKGTLR